MDAVEASTGRTSPPAIGTVREGAFAAGEKMIATFLVLLVLALGAREPRR